MLPFAIEHGHGNSEFSVLLEIVSFHCYFSLPEGKSYIYIYIYINIAFCPNYTMLYMVKREVTRNLGAQPLRHVIFQQNMPLGVRL